MSICVYTNNQARGLDIINTMRTNDIEPDNNTFNIVRNKRGLRSLLKKPPINDTEWLTIFNLFFT